MRDIQDLIEQFYGSPEWQKAKGEEAFKKKYGLRFAICNFLRRMHGLTEKDKTPVEILKTTGLLEFAIRSSWGKSGAREKARRKAARKRLLIRKATRTHKKYLAQKKAERKAEEAVRSPLLFGEGLPFHMRPKKPRGIVA